MFEDGSSAAGPATAGPAADAVDGVSVSPEDLALAMVLRQAANLSLASTDPAGVGPAGVDVPGLVVAMALVDGAGLTGAQIISALDGLERVKAACGAAQARLTERFVQVQALEAQRLREDAQTRKAAGDYEGWVRAKDAALAHDFDPDESNRAGRAGRVGDGDGAAGAGRAGATDAELGRGSRRRVPLKCGVAGQVALARRESPARGARLTSFGVRLVRDLPFTMAALAAGLVTERRAELVARGVAHLRAELRAVVDAEVIGANLPTSPEQTAASTAGGASLVTWGDREVEKRVKACADRLDAKAAVDRARRAANDRRVTLRPVPDTMAQLTALLPVEQAVAVHAALLRAAAAAKAAGDPRGKGQVMADTLVQLVTGQATAADVALEVQLIITDRALFDGDDAPAHIPGYGPVPAGWARDLLARDLHARDMDTRDVDTRDRDDHGVADAMATYRTHPTKTGPTNPPDQPSEQATPRPSEPPREPKTPSSGQAPEPSNPGARRAKVWLRRLFTHPRTGTLVAMDSARRLFDTGLRRFLITRDGTCRTPWCDAPIAHADHVHPWAAGGPTTDTNGQGLCVRCNLVKDLPGWHSTVTDPGPTTGSANAHTVQLTTPTGHTYTSTAPPLLPAHHEHGTANTARDLPDPRRLIPVMAAALTAALAAPPHHSSTPFLTEERVATAIKDALTALTTGDVEPSSPAHEVSFPLAWQPTLSVVPEPDPQSQLETTLAHQLHRQLHRQLAA